jgi:hypothetical protein
MLPRANFWNLLVVKYPSSLLEAYSVVSELVLLQLDVIGVIVGHLPPKPPFSATSSPSIPNQTNAGEQITNTDILSAIESADLFYDLYVTTTNRAIDMHTQAGRRKFALRLHGSLAALDL